jgi:hypothetical protein
VIGLLLALHTADAAPAHSVALDIGRMGSNHRGANMLGYDALATYGFRMVYDLERWPALDLTGGLRFSERRTNVMIYDDVLYQEVGEFESRWFHNTAALGFRLQGQTGWEGFQPYVRGMGSLETAVLRLDEDLDDKENVNRLREVALAPGVELVAGVDIVTAPFGMDVGPDVSPVLFLEMGWNRTGLFDLEEVGEMQFGGYVIRSGIGIAF